MNKRTYIILGYQRSGTNILRQSLQHDNDIDSYNESRESVFFKDWYLKSKKRLSEASSNINKHILIKPISEDKKRSYPEIVELFDDRDVTLIYLYRDPVNIYYSAVVKWGMSVDSFIKEWNERASKFLKQKSGLKINTIVVKYEDLVASKDVFNKLCKETGIKGKYLFNKDSRNGYKNLSDNIINKIKLLTNKVYSQLNDSRSIRSNIGK